MDQLNALAIFRAWAGARDALAARATFVWRASAHASTTIAKHILWALLDAGRPEGVLAIGIWLP